MKTLFFVLAAAFGFHGSDRDSVRVDLSSDTRTAYAKAADAAPKDPMLALVRLECLLMPNPVSVGVDKGTIPSGSQGFLDGVRQGLSAWSYLGDSPYKLSEMSEAQLVVKFVDSVPNRAHAQGMIDAKRQYRWSHTVHEYRVYGTMYIVRKTGERLLSRDEVGLVVAHELGHLLGLGDVSDPNMLMGPFYAGKRQTGPTADERTYVQDFRAVLREGIKKLSDPG